MIFKLALASLAVLSSTIVTITTASDDAKKIPSAALFGKTLRMPNDITANSELGQRLLSKARRVEEDDEDDKDEEEDNNDEKDEEEDDKDDKDDEEENREGQNDFSDFAWIGEYSLKFQGCHHIAQWNDEVDEGDDVRIMTRRLVRFRLCETRKCSDTNTAGCKKGYGDYVVDLSTFARSYIEYQQTVKEYEYEDYDDGEDGEDEQEDFELDRYMECERIDEGGDRRRHLEDKDKEEDGYYVGPYCAEQGGGIFLGLFTDDACTNFADDDGGKDTYYALTNEVLPYGSSSIVDMNCMSCSNADGVYGDDYYVGDQCGQPYLFSGKCENKLNSGTVGEQNNAGCSYIAGIQITREDGVLNVIPAKASKVATFFIVLFAASFFFFLYYVYLLKKKLSRKSVLL